MIEIEKLKLLLETYIMLGEGHLEKKKICIVILPFWDAVRLSREVIFNLHILWEKTV